MDDVDLGFLPLDFFICCLASSQLAVFLSGYVVSVASFCRSLCEVVLKVFDDHGDSGVG